jgi:DNA-binding PadR family transcriptional regulator
MPEDLEPEPLRPLVFQILLLLNEVELHGYAIMQELNERAGRSVILGPATLYRTLKELRDAGLIEEAPSDDDRRRIYRLTDEGERTARAEARRMEAMVERARAGHLIR